MKRMMTLSRLASVAAFAIGFSLPAMADNHHVAFHDFHGRDFGHFSPVERAAWVHGAWHQSWHDGRFGWWWTVGPYWYFYPEPIYPYPLYVPPAVVVQQPPPTPTGLPPAQSWYFCDNPSGYYPYVASCNGSWRQVPTTPPGAPQSTAPTATPQSPPAQ